MIESLGFSISFLATNWDSRMAVDVDVDVDTAKRTFPSPSKQGKSSFRLGFCQLFLADL